MKKMEFQNLQLSGDFMALQLYLLLELNIWFENCLKWSWSLVLCLINENYTTSGEEISYVCVFQTCVTLRSGFNGAYEENKYQDEDFPCTGTNYHYGSKTFHIRHWQLTKDNPGKSYEVSNVKCFTPELKGYSARSYAHSVMDAGKVTGKLAI